MNFESSLILGSFFFTVIVKLLLKDYLEDLGVICLFLQILYLGWYWAIPIIICTPPPLLRNLGISRGGGALTLEFPGERCINFKFPGEGYINLKISRKGGIQAL